MATEPLATAPVRSAVLTVGGAPEPIIRFLREWRPEFLLFIVSEQSLGQVTGGILPAVDYIPQYSTITVSEPENLARCYAEIRDALPDWLAEKRLAPDEVVADITGGTKPMSAGLALAAVELFPRFTYVGGSRREKEGLGVVITGAEKVISMVNPWDEMAVRELDLAGEFYRSGQAAATAIILERAAVKCSRRRAELSTLARLCGWLARADDFRFHRLYEEFRSQETVLQVIFSGERLPLFSALHGLAEHWRRVAQEAKTVSAGTSAPATLLELLANADRRSGQERYDDAAARLYRATELAAQNRLSEAFGARLGNVRLDQVPENSRRAFAERFADCLEDDGSYRLALARSFEALAYSPRQEDHDFSFRYADLRDSLQFRNQSILAHGLVSVSAEHYVRFRSKLLEVLQVRDADVPSWPEIDFR